MSPVEVVLTEQGYLQLAAEVALRYFPDDALVVTSEPDALWLWPLRSAEAGGLLLKCRNAAGDRSVLIAEMLPPETPPGPKPAEWDEARGAMRLTLEALKATGNSWRVPKNSVGVSGIVAEEKGRWVVYLEVGSWLDDAPDAPLLMQRHRIADYPTAERARIAAEWIQRSADRSPTVRWV